MIRFRYPYYLPTIYYAPEGEGGEGGSGGEGGNKGGQGEGGQGGQKGGEGGQKELQPGQLFSSGFNEGVKTGMERGEKRVLDQIREAGGNFNSVEDLATFVKSKPVTDVTQHDAYVQLESKNKELSTKVNELTGQIDTIQRNGTIQGHISETINSIKDTHDVLLTPEQIMNLYQSEFQIKKNEAGQLRAFKGDVPDMNESGNIRTLNDSLTNYIKNASWSVLKGQGTGAGEGQGGSGNSNPPKHKDYQKAVREKNGELADKLYGEFKAAGNKWDYSE